jgi:hypothetical protein
MTGDASLHGSSRARVVLSVIETRAEVAERGEIFDRRILTLDARVTDRTERRVLRDELREMTIGASLVTGQARHSRIVCGARMARRAGERSVSLSRV